MILVKNLMSGSINQYSERALVIRIQLVDRTKNRSDSYQSYYNECPCSHETMAHVAEMRGLTARLNAHTYNEELLDLQDRLKEEFWRVVQTQLTDRQQQVLQLSADGHTQMEIAKILDVNQSSITKSINGNCDYRNGKKVYGGANKKLKKIIDKDSKIQEILKRIAEIRIEEESY